jgi:hypothetical protein
MSTIATTHTNTLLKEGESPPDALTGGYTLPFWVAAGFMVLGAIITIVVLRNRDVPVSEAAAEPA